MSEKIEIAFDENTGKFVFHVSGAASHEREHQIFNEFLAKLHDLGYNTDVEFFHDHPKLPDLQNETAGPLAERN